MFISIISVFLLAHISNDFVTLFAKSAAITALAMSMAIAVIMIRLGLMAKYKKSQIYYTICKRLNGHVSDRFRHKLKNMVEKLDETYKKNSEKHVREHKHNPYIKDEFRVLAYMYAYFKKNGEDEIILCRIVNIAVNMIMTNDISYKESINRIITKENAEMPSILVKTDYNVRQLFMRIEEEPICYLVRERILQIKI